MKYHDAGGQQQMERFGYTTMTAGQTPRNTNTIPLYSSANGETNEFLTKFNPNKRNLTSFVVGACLGLLIAKTLKSDCTMCYLGYSLSVGLSAYILSSLVQSKTIFREV